jgi:hypothetical protein
VNSQFVYPTQSEFPDQGKFAAPGDPIRHDEIRAGSTPDVLAQTVLAQAVSARDIARFDALMKVVFRKLSEQVERPAPTPPLPLRARDGTALGDMKASPKALTIRIASAQAPEFARWMHDNAETQLQRMFETFKAEQNAE